MTLASALGTEPKNYYHFSLEVIGKLLLLLSHTEAEEVNKQPLTEEISVKFLLPDTSFTAQYLDILDIPLDRVLIYEHANRRYHAHHLLLPKWKNVGSEEARERTQPYSHYYPPARVLRLIRKNILNRVITSPQGELEKETTAPKIVYLSRAGSDKRHVYGEERLIEALREEYQEMVHVFSGAIMSVRAQIEFFSDADVLIGPHGAGK